MEQGNQMTDRKEHRTMKNMPAFALIFALAFMIFFIAPAFLSFAFPAYPLMRTGDAFDLLTPLVLLPLYWGLLQRVSNFQPHRRQILGFVFLAALWELGQGMHLSANSIGHQLAGDRDWPFSRVPISLRWCSSQDGDCTGKACPSPVQHCRFAEG
jgi:hypothetical protein